jgi:hypothetical protein
MKGRWTRGWDGRCNRRSITYVEYIMDCLPLYGNEYRMLGIKMK